MINIVYRRYRAAFEGLPFELWIMALMMLVNRAGAMVLAYLTLYLTSTVGMTEVSAGRMISVFGAGSIVGSYLGGRLVDWIGAIRVQTLCLLAAVPGYLMMMLWVDTWAITVNLFLLSLATEAVRPANATVVTKLTKPEDRARAFALQRLAANLGFAVGGAVGGVLAEIDFRLLFIVDAGTTFAAACILIAYFQFRRLPGEVKRSENTATATPMTDFVFLAFLALFVLATMVFFQFLSTYTLYLENQYGLSRPQIGALFAVNTLVIVALEMVLIDYVKRWPLLWTVGWGCFFSCLGFGLLPFGSTFSFAVLAMLVMTLGEMLSMPLAAGYVANRAPVGCEGRYMGWWAMGIALAFVFGPIIGTTVYQSNPDMVWYISIVVGFVVLVGYYLLPRSALEEDQSLVTEEALAPTEPADLVAESAS
ncbi:MFS transporter [Aeoliella sp.]|uniref:MFS transporter n=1 Tax=Aeoliella sp. TaxID=2795800 RepID=UPI003CCBFD0F